MALASSVPTRGGGIYNTGAERGADDDRLHLSRTPPTAGGGLFNDGVTDMTAPQTNGFYTSLPASATLTDCTVSDNSANADGGGIVNLAR